MSSNQIFFKNYKFNASSTSESAEGNGFDADTIFRVISWNRLQLHSGRADRPVILSVRAAADWLFQRLRRSHPLWHRAYANHLSVLLPAGLFPLHCRHYAGSRKGNCAYVYNACLLVCVPGELYYGRNQIYQPADHSFLGISHHLESEQYRIFDLLLKSRLDSQF